MNKIVRHGVNGFLCDQNEQSLAKYIIELLLNEDIRKKMGQAAREFVVNHYNDEDRMLPILKLLKKKYSLNNSW